MGVLIDNRQETHPVMLEGLEKKAQAVLDALGCPEKELSILLVDDPQIAELNATYLQREGPTNVIAFPMQAGEFAGISPDLLGDVVISLDTAGRESRVAGIDMETRTIELLVHGVLHLLGYDHEHDHEEARRMEAKSIKVLKTIERA
ncbi:MAG: rRNA maturation RNase YbeY [Deltaproteobacteria bacterium]|nr:rRNA maturation RNase YbeY [Deltaproteobacteria bacterium]MBW2634648.1 rRNA maturation RNase YbeY [Deltaproteobacteria bacterium]